MGQYDIGGDDLFSGDDELDLLLGGDTGLDIGDDILLGADAAPARRPKVRLQRIQPVEQTQVLNFPQGPNGATTFTAGLSGVMSVRPQRVFKTERLAIPSTVSPYFVIHDLVIGRDSMFVNSNYAHAEIFSQTGVGVALKGFIARPGIDITLSAENLDSNSRAFYGSIIGPALV